jgi:rifampin ADP-ribosylating transferase
MRCATGRPNCLHGACDAGAKGRALEQRDEAGARLGDLVDAIDVTGGRDIPAIAMDRTTRAKLGVDRGDPVYVRPSLVSGATDRASPSKGTFYARRVSDDVLDDGPFFHGTKADLQPGDLLTAGFRSNYRPEVVMNHIYFTALRDGAGLAAELAAGSGEPRVYEVEPTGAFEDDPNVTDKKFPGNPTRSYRSTDPIRVVREVDDWPRLAPEDLQAWRDRLAVLLSDERGEIIN